MTVCVLGSGVSAASPGPSSASAPTWAYGEIATKDFHGTAGAYTYQGSATFGFSVIFNETRNSSEGLVTVNVVRTIGAILHVEFCRPDCALPRVFANASFHAWETTDAWDNLTTQGSVSEVSGTVPGLALLNSSVGVAAKLRESAESSDGSTVLRDRSLVVNATGHVRVNLTSALGLGLYPLSLTSGSYWNSSSGFNATGAVAWSLVYSEFGSLVPSPVLNKTGGNISASHAGTVALQGEYSAGSDFGFRGASFPAVNLSLTGPFTLAEGVILVPVGADVFGGGSHPWSTDQHSSAVETTVLLDVRPGAAYQGHLPIVASSFWVKSASANAATSFAGGSSRPTPAESVAASPTNSTQVQGQPESTADAQGDQNCLVTGIGCPSGSSPSSPVRYFVLVGAVAVVGAILAMTVVARRRPLPPVYPNAALYPPGSTVPTTPRPPAVPKPAEDDPLGHLW
ncbi:MAG: hypothetical protein WBG19_03870 [Thermoplasmata archaeon]